MPRLADRAFAVLPMGYLAVVTDSESRAVGLRRALGIAATIVPADALAREAGFGPLDYLRTLRRGIPGFTLAALGFQTILLGFFVSILGMSWW